MMWWFLVFRKKRTCIAITSVHANCSLLIIKGSFLWEGSFCTRLRAPFPSLLGVAVALEINRAVEYLWLSFPPSNVCFLQATPKKQPIYIPPTVLGVTDKGDTWNIKMLKWFGRTTGFFSRKNVS